jgi:hypothetical protein
MKHLKTFNDTESGIWMVPTNSTDYYVAKWLIGGDNALNTIYVKDEKYMLLHYREYFSKGGKDNTNNWSWSNVDSYNSNNGRKFLLSKDYKGIISITKNDINNYNMHKDIKKFNL